MEKQSENLEERTFLNSPTQEDLRPTPLEQNYARILIDMQREVAPRERDY